MFLHNFLNVKDTFSTVSPCLRVQQAGLSMMHFRSVLIYPG